MGPVHSEIIIIMKAFISLLSWPSLPQFLLKTPLRFSLPRQYSMQPSLLLRLVNTLVLPLFKSLPYLADLPEVAEAKAAHALAFNAYTAGTVALPVAPVFTGVQPAHVVAPVVATPAVAPVAVAYGGYPY